ncbi:biopolymer transporter ExbD [Myxococcota bacterium]|nr:biopolymer transporter ExbD [Myxococcota bacterium]
MRFARPRTEVAGSPLAPLLDVVLLLLIFFVVTSSFSNQALELALPPADSGRPQDRQGLVIAIDEAGSISIGSERIAAAGLRERLLAAKAAGQPMELRADRATAHEHVVAVLDLAQASGVLDLSIAVAAGSTPTPSQAESESDAPSSQ